MRCRLPWPVPERRLQRKQVAIPILVLNGRRELFGSISTGRVVAMLHVRALGAKRDALGEPPAGHELAPPSSGPSEIGSWGATVLGVPAVRRARAGR
jgi:hypothetical protein